MAATLETADLLLMPYPAEDLLAIIEGIDPSEGPPAKRAADPWLYTFATIHHQNRLFAGGVGYKGPPDEKGVVEIAQGIEPPYDGRGYATQAAEARTAYAFADDRVQLVRAHTLPEPNASTRVLIKCAFTKIGEVNDPEDGPVGRWERPKASA